MCGITGIFGNLKKDNLKKSVQTMSATLTHRGPDDHGIWVNNKDGVAFGHQRLSIMDLSFAGHQPMASPCKRFVVVFNGEIYNHLQIRKKLNKHKQDWRGHSDTETLVSAFSQWGIEKTLDQLTGMFAIAVWDSKDRNLSLIRDRFGEKPLYYGWSNGVFLFGSELKSLRKYNGFNNKIDRRVLSLYMEYMYVPNPYSIFENIYKLEPGCVLRIDESSLVQPLEDAPFAPFKSQGLSVKQWYSLSDVARNSQKNLIKNEKEAIESLEETLLESVRSQLITDVPLGAFLSGGIDSSIIVSLMQRVSKTPVKTFTIGFEESAFNEATYAKGVSKHIGTDHYELYVTANDALKVVPDLPILYDEPFADSSQIPTYLVSKLAHQNVSVSLSGDAGDELFGGYNRYLWSERVWSKLKWMPPIMRKTIGTAIQKLPISTWDVAGHMLSNKYRVESMGGKAHRLAHRLKTVNSLDDMYHSLVAEGSNEDSLVSGSYPALKIKLNDSNIVKNIDESVHRMMLLDTLTYLPDDILTKVDRAAMGVSLETRIPFLDYRVVELAWRLPLNIKINNGIGKWPLREILYKYVPKELIERPKAGFAIPVGQWLRGPLREWADDLLNGSIVQDDRYFDSKLVERMWVRHLSGKYDYAPSLWAILMFVSWINQ